MRKPTHSTRRAFSSAVLVPLLLCALPPGCGEPQPLRGPPGIPEGGADSTDGGSESPASSDEDATGGDSTGAPASGDAGTDAGTTGDGDSSTGLIDDSESTGGPPACDLATHRCIGPAPEGWNGPVEMATGPADAPLVACADPSDAAAITAFADLSAPPALCGCDCGTPQGAECDAVTTIAYYPNPLTGPFAGMHPSNSNVNDCNYPGWWFDLEDVSLVEAAGETPSRWIATAPEVIGGSCSASAEVEIPVASFATRIQACGLVAERVDVCEDDGICVPQSAAPFEAPACIWQTGAQECPMDSEYSVRTVWSTDVDDDRGCSACGCGNPTDQSCDDATAYVWTGFSSHEIAADGVCRYIGDSGDVTAVSFSAGNPSGGTCQESGGDPQGGATATGPITTCCTE